MMNKERVKQFNDNISAICKVEFSLGGFVGGYITRRITLDEGKFHCQIDRSRSLKASDPKDAQDCSYAQETFLNGLCALQLGEWEKEYMNLNVLDGTQWELTIEFSNGQEPYTSSGSNAYPRNFDNFLELLGIDLQDE